MSTMSLRDLIQALDPAKIDKVVERQMKLTAIDAESIARVNAATVLKVRSGYLRRSIIAKAEKKGEEWEVRLRAGGGDRNVRYAAIHEYGGVIRPIKGQFLAIPTALSKTASGVARYSGPSTDPRPMAYVQSLRGQPLLVDASRTKRGKATKRYGVDVLYVLRRRVIIPARPYARPAMEEAAKNLRTRLAAQVAAALSAP
jgi:hypothetical protein